MSSHPSHRSFTTNSVPSVPTPLYQPHQPADLSARTRSMSKLALIANSRLHDRTFSKAQQIAKRQPLMEMVLDAQNMNGRKRKVGDELDRPKKVSRFEPGASTALHRRITSAHKRIPLASIATTPRGKPSSGNTPKPTLARDILRQRPNEAEEMSMSPGESPDHPLVPRPPTPPRPHIPSDEDDIVNLQVRSTLKRALTPEHEVDGRINLTSIRRLDFSKLVTGAATPRRPMGPVQHLDGSCEGGNRLVSRISEIPPQLDLSAATIDPISSQPGDTSSPILRTPLKPPVAPSPRRVMAGISRFRLSAPPSPPFAPALASTSFTTKFTGTSGYPTEMPGLRRVQEEEELETPTCETPQQLVVLASAAPLPLLKGTSARTHSDMNPPSRIPTGIRSSRLPLSKIPRPSALPATVEIQETSAPSHKPDNAISSLPRPMNSHHTTAILGKGMPTTTIATTEKPTTRRKPSYPSSLGSGPLARPTQRMVSNPVLPPRAPVNTSNNVDKTLRQPVSPRSVSAPAAGSRSSMSTSRREGLSLETSQRVNGLSEALEKLKMKNAESSSRLSLASSGSRTSPAALTSHTVQPRAHLSASTSTRMSAVHRPRQSSGILAGDVSVVPEHTNSEAADRSLSALICSTTGGGCLRGVVAFVDVRTEEGADSSAIFGDILRSLGAKVRSSILPSSAWLSLESGVGKTERELHACCLQSRKTDDAQLVEEARAEAEYRWDQLGDDIEGEGGETE